MNWRNAADYRFGERLGAAEWAWQFLRRAPEYRRDYAEFIVTWRALEADYGTPPHRDFPRWRLDPRAWRSEAELVACGGEMCPTDDGRLLIECWLGAKWGFRKFPIDPDLPWPEPGVELDWREPAREVPEWTGEVAELAPERVALVFDLSLPVQEQLRAARIPLLARQRTLARAGRVPPYRVSQAWRQWTDWLRLLDSQSAGIELSEAGAWLHLADPVWALDQARRMCAGGYRRILLMDA